jgi:hypothetical protein
MEKVTLSTQLVNGIMQYLGNRPYVEVANLITAVQQEAQANAVEAAVAEAKESGAAPE